MKAKFATSGVFLCSAISIVWLLLGVAPGYRPVTVVAALVGLALASVGLFPKPRVGYCLGMVSGMVALHWFVGIEFRYFPALNSWIAFNLPGDNPYLASDIHAAILKILFAAAVLAATLCSITRLLPAKWVLRNVPLRERTWPPIAACFLLVGLWYLVSASPYRIPLIADGVQPELAMLHVEKHGAQFHETAVTAYRDGKLYVRRNDRRFFQYEFASLRGSGTVPDAISPRVHLLVQSSQLLDMRTPPAIALREKNAEGWYIRINRTVLAFTTEYGTKPPREIVDLFHDLEAASPDEKHVDTIRDVCMGFCYDPLAGLGIVNMNDRCTDQNGTRCR